MTTVLIAVLVSFVLALLIGILLGFFKKVFAVPVDANTQMIRDVLPGVNCGACGYPGCDGFAAACAAGQAPADGCAAGGVKTAQAVAKVLGVKVEAEEHVIVLACRGSRDTWIPRGMYNGVQSCVAAHQAVNGTKMCQWGCIGFGDCTAVCKFDALTMGKDRLPHVDTKKCTGCGMCATTCPMHLFLKVPVSRKGAVALCANRNENRTLVLKTCKVGCIKCGKCERNCEKGAIKVTDGIPVVDYALCNSCGTCIDGCPTHVLALVQNII